MNKSTKYILISLAIIILPLTILGGIAAYNYHAAKYVSNELNVSHYTVKGML